MLQPKKRICKKRFVVEDINALHRFANTMLTPLMQRKNILFLRGDLGAGKTTFVRAFMQAAGYQAPIQSPTYGIVHSYQEDDTTIHHFDCYRIGSEEELWDLGLEDYLQSGICIVEWPEHEIIGFRSNTMESMTTRYLVMMTSMRTPENETD